MNSIQTLTPRTHTLKLNESHNELAEQARISLKEKLEEIFFVTHPNICLLITGSIARKESIGIGRTIDLILVHQPVATTLTTPSQKSTPTPHVLKRSFLSPMNPLPNVTPISPERMRSADTHEPFLSQSFESSLLERSDSVNSVPNDTPIHNEIIYSPELLTIIQKIQEAIAEYPKLFNPELDVYDLGSTRSPLKCEYPKGSVTIPNLAIDSFPLLGNTALGEEYRATAYQYIKKMNWADRKDFDKHFWSPSIQNLNRCIDGTETKPVNIQTGLLFFDNNRMMSTKFTLLRPIQYQLMYLLIQSTQNLEETFEECQKKAQDIPLKIIDRILWMHKLGMLPTMTDHDVNELCRAYDLSLQWYEQSQIAFDKDQSNEIYVPHEELKQVTNIIQAFVTKTNPKILFAKKPKNNRILSLSTRTTM